MNIDNNIKLKDLVYNHNNDYGFDVNETIKNNKNKKLPSLSIVIPYFNTGAVFKKTIEFLFDSVAKVLEADSSWECEIIVIDDGSNDRASNYIDTCKHKNVKVINFKKNKGRVSARNRGLAESIFDLVLFMDSDILTNEDIILENLIIHSNKKHQAGFITVGFFSFCDINNLKKPNFLEAKTGNDFRLYCCYEESWIGCEKDRQFVGKEFEVVKTTDLFRKWPKDGFFGPWSLPNMVLGGFFMVQRKEALLVGGFNESFSDYGFTETSLPTKLIAKFNHFVVPVNSNVNIHVGNQDIDISKEEKDLIFKKKHEYYFLEFMNLTLEESFGFKKLNLVFHNIIREDRILENIYETSDTFVENLLDRLIEYSLRDPLIQVQVFLDDGFSSHFDFAYKLKEKYSINVFLAINTENVGKKGYLTLEQIKKINKHGVIVTSHGVSHASFGKYLNNVVIGAVGLGVYRNTPGHKGCILSKNEILFQLRESYLWFLKNKIPVQDFVYTYGIYNEKIKEILDNSCLYKKAYGCDWGVEFAGLDSLELPRMVITSDIDFKQWVDIIIKKVYSIDRKKVFVHNY